MGLVIRSIIFLALLFSVEYYFYRKLLRAVRLVLKLNRIKKLYIIIIIFILNIYPLFLFVDWSYAGLTGTPVLIPQNTFFDYLVIYPFWLMILIDIQCSFFFLAMDLLKLPLLPFYKKIKLKVYSIESKIIFALIVVFVVYVPARVIHDYNKIQVRHVNFVKKDLPVGLNGFKIVFISDIHADRYTDGARLIKYINDVNSAKPGLVLIGGDLISSGHGYIDTAAKYLGRIKSVYGIFSCVGDHYNWAYHRDYKKSLNEVENALKVYNIEMIDNGSIILNLKNTDIKITLITDTYVEHISKKFLDRLTPDSAKYGLKILLVHQPRQEVVSRASKTGYNLLLAGHTHGGQITFLFPFKNLTPTLLETEYIRGNFHFNKMLMIVTRGLGMSLVPVRYNSTPEVTVINISKEKD